MSIHTKSIVYLHNDTSRRRSNFAHSPKQIEHKIKIKNTASAENQNTSTTNWHVEWDELGSQNSFYLHWWSLDFVLRRMGITCSVVNVSELICSGHKNGAISARELTMVARTKFEIKKYFLDTSADPKSEPPGGPKNGSGLIFRNSSGAQFADPKTGPRERAGTSFGTSSFAALTRAVLVDLDSWSLYFMVSCST